jgi:hypothetical protein
MTDSTDEVDWYDVEEQKERAASAARHAAEALLDLVNHADDPSEFVKLLTEDGHRTLQQGAMAVFVKVIRAHAAKGHLEFDGRNSATVKLCKAITERCADELCLPIA